MTLFVGGVVVGLALGWGLHWYLSQRERTFSRRLRLLHRPPVATAEAAPLVSVQPVERATFASGPATEPAPDQPSPPGEPTPPSAEHEILAYCVRCRQKRPMHEPRLAEGGDGRPAYRGTCVVCSARMFALR